MRVRMGQGIDHFHQQPDGFVQRQFSLAANPLAQRLAGDIGHHIVKEAVDIARVEQREDVRMLQLGRDLDLTKEPRRPERGGEVFAQHLDRHLAMVLDVLGEVHGGHAARAELALDLVAAAEGGGQAGNSVSGQAPSRDGAWESSWSAVSGNATGKYGAGRAWRQRSGSSGPIYSRIGRPVSKSYSVNFRS